MKLLFSGDINGIGASDTISKIEIAMRVLGESAAAAVAAGRVITITDAGEIADFMDTGVEKASDVYKTPVSSWRKISVNVTGDSSATIDIDGMVLYEGTLGLSSIRMVGLQFTNMKGGVEGNTYVAEFKRDGNTIDDLTSSTGWTLDSGASLSFNQTFDGKTCLKTTNTTNATGGIFDKNLGSNQTGVFEIYVYTPTGMNMALWLGDATWSSFMGITLQESYFRVGYSTASDLIFTALYHVTPSVRITEDNEALGEIVGSWADGDVIIPKRLPMNMTGMSAVHGNASVDLSWVAFPWVSELTGYCIYRATSQNGTYAFVGYTTNTTYTDTGLTNGVTYWYKIGTSTTDEEAMFSQNNDAVSATPHA